jgi:hypothetical protein
MWHHRGTVTDRAGRIFELYITPNNLSVIYDRSNNRSYGYNADEYVSFTPAPSATARPYGYSASSVARQNSAVHLQYPNAQGYSYVGPSSAQAISNQNPPPPQQMPATSQAQVQTLAEPAAPHVSSSAQASKLELVRAMARGLSETAKLEEIKHPNSNHFKNAGENQHVLDTEPVMAEGVAGCIAIAGIGFYQGQRWNVTMHCGANALATPAHARDCLDTVMGALNFCSGVKLYLAGGDDEGAEDAYNLLVHKDHYPIVGAKICLSKGNGPIESIDFVSNGGRLLIYYSEGHSRTLNR